ncbi:MAG: NAD-dependent epimerase/dehydratase family protein [Rhodospirillales bacterium]
MDEIVTRLRQAAIKLSGKTILLTGGRGFLGRYFTEVFSKLNESVLDKPVKLIVLDNLITAGKDGSKIPEIANVTFIQHDVIQPYACDVNIDYIIHAAGIASPFYYKAHPLETLEVAVSGTKNMLELAKRHDARLVFFSSSEIYGDPDPKHVPTAESYRGHVACVGSRACYDESKRVGETLCSIYHEMDGVSTGVIRPFNVYGPGMQEADYRVLPNFASRIKARQPLHVYGSGNQTRTYCYITDAMVGFLLVFLNGVPGEVYNIGNPKPEISVLDLAKTIEGVLARKIDYDVVEYPDSYPPDEPNRRCPDIRKARLQIEYAPEVSLEDGLRRFLSWTDSVYTGIQ